MRRRLLLAAATLGIALRPAAAHIGSPDVYLEEAIGPWPAIVVVAMPSAVPGEARVEVRLTDLKAGEEAGVRFQEIPPEGDNAAPGWIVAKRSAAEANLFVAPMPLMTYGVWRARVEVAGARGTATTDVPVAAKSPPSQAMNRSLGTILGALTLFLLVSLWLIVRALARDVYADPRHPRPWWVRFWPTATSVGFAAVLGFHMVAWRQMDAILTRKNARTTTATLSPVATSPEGATRFRLAIVDAKRRPVEDVLPDHGKMMHAVVVKVPEMTYFLHAHPSNVEPGVFELTVAPPAPGAYRVFADVLHSTGVAETVTATFASGTAAAARPAAFDDPDDSEAIPPALGAGAASGTRCDAGEGYTMALVSPEARPIRSKELLDLAFELDGPDGRPVDALEAYMGMAGHLLIFRDDLGVFAHVHPMGTVSGRMMAMPGSHAAMTPEEHAKAMAAMGSIPGSRVSFPYGFPGPGRYRLFAQVKRGGKVRTGVFDVTVD